MTEVPTRVPRARILTGAVLFSLLAQAVMSANAAELPAMLDWSGRVSLTLPVPGVLDKVLVQSGQSVKKGELLASVDATQFKAAVAEARAEMDRLVEEQSDARRDLERVQELYARTVASTTELDAAKLRHARSSAALAATQARLERVRRQLADAELRAPFDALILQRHGEPGLVITHPCQPAPVFTIARSDELIARAALTPEQAAALRVPGRGDVVLGDNVVNAELRALSVDAERRYSLELALPRTSGLMPGQLVRIRLP